MRAAIVCAAGAALLMSILPATPAAADPCGTYDGTGCAPLERRVDLAAPQFAHPTEVTNPLFPISDLHSAVLLGHVEGERFRTETTLLPATGTVTWAGQTFPVLLSQYVAYRGRHLEEVALDRYAQADDGSVWYLGEDVFEYGRHGTVSATEGTWLAGRDGPGAMIMPAHPGLGDVYRPENAPGVVFEEVTVTGVGLTVRGPTGPVPGAISVRELHQDHTHETKLFAPGYGEFRTAGGGDLEALATAVPTDTRLGPEPWRLQKMATLAEGVLESARVREWPAVRAGLRRMRASWQVLDADDPPWRVAARLSRDLAGASRAATRHRPAHVAQRALDVWQSVLDLQLRYRSPGQVDVARMHLWTQQLRVFAAAGDLGAVTGAVASLEWMRDRVTGTLTPADLQRVDVALRDLRAATDAGNRRAAGDRAARLGALLRR